MPVVTAGLPALVKWVAEDFVRSKCPAQVVFGKEYLAENTSFNRVVFVPSSDSFPLPNTYPGRNPRDIYIRNVGCDAVIWAGAPPQADASEQRIADYSVLTALVNQTVLSIARAVSPPGVTFNSGTQRFEAVQLAYGAAYVLSFTIQVPIVDIQFPELGIDQDVFTWRVADPVSAELTPDLDTDDSDD